MKLATAALATFATAWATAPAANVQTAQPAARYASVYRGTVHAVRPQAGTLDLITGVGFALRLVHMRSGPGVSVASLKPGDVVRAVCHTTSAGLVADTLQRVEPAR